MTSYNNTIGLPAVHTSQGVTNQYNVALSSYFNGSYPFTPNMGFVNFQQSNMAESISHPIPLYSAQPNNLGYVYLQSGLGHYCPSPAQPASYMTHPQANLVSSVPIQPAQVQPQPAQIPIQQAHPYSSSQAFQTMTLQESNWNMDTGASSHLAENTGMLTSFSNPSLYKSVFVGNGQPIPVTHTGHSLLHTPHKPLHLHHVLVTPNIIKNLISVRQFTRDNNVSVDFDAYGFSVKDYQTRRLLLRCDSTGDLYPVTQQPSSTTTFALLSLSPTTWHRRLGHPSEDMLRRLESSHFISYNKTKLPALCHACQLGKHTKLPFYSSESNVGSVFDIIHSDLWTSPISSESGIKYYAIFLDHFSHYVWVYPLLHKSDLFDTFVTFRAYVNKQFNVDIKALQCDHGASSTALLQRIITLLHSEFAMTDLGSLNYFLGVSAQRSKFGFFLSQSKFVEEILERHMQHCNPCKTPVDTESKLGSDGDPVSDPTLYRSLAGALQYLTFTRPDISYDVQQICLYMHDPRDPHFTALKHADWAGCPVTRRSTSGYCVFLGDNLLSWSAKRQVTLSRSSAEAEYRGVANVVAETAWIRNLLLELHTPLFTATLVYCDNVSAVYLSTNPVQHQRTKHIEIDIHFVREYVASGQVRVLHVPSRFQYADIFTKGLPTALFLEFRSSLNVRRSPAHTEGEY
ncbi:ribonuclease H-like domain-containing protein [Tanacetum coccineum]